jgi:hypothetical protein
MTQPTTEVLRCAACGAPVANEAVASSQVCAFCGTNYMLAQVSKVGDTTITNLVEMAETAQRAGDKSEATSYWNRVLEAQPNNANALVCKGELTSTAGSLAKFDPKNGIPWFEKALTASASYCECAIIILIKIQKIIMVAISSYHNFHKDRHNYDEKRRRELAAC